MEVNVWMSHAKQAGVAAVVTLVAIVGLFRARPARLEPAGTAKRKVRPVVVHLDPPPRKSLSKSAKALDQRLHRAKLAFHQGQHGRRVPKPAVKPAGNRRPTDGADEAARRAEAAKRFVAARPDPMQNLRRRIGPVQNYDDDT